ncbi:unnamed protein product [Urochloa humidicola]
MLDRDLEKEMPNNCVARKETSLWPVSLKVMTHAMTNLCHKTARRWIESHEEDRVTKELILIIYQDLTHEI